MEAFDSAGEASPTLDLSDLAPLAEDLPLLRADLGDAERRLQVGTES
jgi:hypothetical protein